MVPKWLVKPCPFEIELKALRKRDWHVMSSLPILRSGTQTFKRRRKFDAPCSINSNHTEKFLCSIVFTIREARKFTYSSEIYQD